MTPISKEDYIKFLEELTDHQYGDDDDTYYIPEDAWIPAESPAKEKMKISNHLGVIDVLKYKKNKIQEALYKCMNIKIGSYLVRIVEYHGTTFKNGTGANLSMDIEVWETVYKTPSGNPCKMEYNKNFHKDNRFTGKPWLSYFSNSGKAHNIPVETVVDVIRWLQAIQRISAFL